MVITDDESLTEFKELQSLEVLASHAPYYVQRIDELISREVGCPNLPDHTAQAVGWRRLLRRYGRMNTSWQIDRARLAGRVLTTVYGKILEAERLWGWGNRVRIEGHALTIRNQVCDAPGPEGI